MIARLTRCSMLAVVTTIVSLAFSASTVEAGHGSYRYIGRPVGCGGEAHMIRALAYIDQAFAELHYDPHHHAATAAHQEVEHAEQELQSPAAQASLEQACAELSHFEATHCADELANAGRLIARALKLEQQYHVSCHSHHHGGPAYYQQGYPSRTFGGGYRTNGSQFGFSIQGRHGGASFRFSR